MNRTEESNKNARELDGADANPVPPYERLSDRYSPTFRRSRPVTISHHSLHRAKSSVALTSKASDGAKMPLGTNYSTTQRASSCQKLDVGLSNPCTLNNRLQDHNSSSKQPNSPESVPASTQSAATTEIDSTTTTITTAKKNHADDFDNHATSLTATSTLTRPRKEWHDLVDMEQVHPEQTRRLLRRRPNDKYRLQLVNIPSTSRPNHEDYVIRSWWDPPPPTDQVQIDMEPKQTTSSPVRPTRTVSLVQRQLEEQHLVVKRNEIVVYPTNVSARKLGPREVMSWVDSPTFQKPKLSSVEKRLPDSRVDDTQLEDITGVPRQPSPPKHDQHPPQAFEKQDENMIREGAQSPRRQRSRRNAHAPSA